MECLPQNFQESEWFEKVFGFKETIFNIERYIDIEEVEQDIVLNIYNKKNGTINLENSYLAGRFTTRNISSFSENGETYAFHPRQNGKFSISGNLSDYMFTYSIPELCGATFQVDTNFNCLNNISIDQTPDEGVSYYIYNNSNGSQASVSTAASLIFRNYFLNSATQEKINLIKNTSLEIEEGFSLLNEIEFINDDVDPNFDYKNLDYYEVGVQENCQVILARYDENNLIILPYDQIIHQVFVSSFDLSKNKKNSINQIKKIEPFLLEAEYKSTILAAWENSLKYPDNPGSKKCFLTAIGYELCNVPLNMIFDAIKSCQSLIIESGLDVCLIANDQDCFAQACFYLGQLVNLTSGDIINDN